MTGPNPDDLAAAVAYLLGQKLLSDPAELHRRLTNLEALMSKTEDAIADLNTATNDLAARIDAILSRDAALDATTAGELQQVSDRLKGLAVDPADPVPASGGGTPTA